MQHKFKLTVIGGIIFSYLFYQQQLGINALVFSIVLLIFMFIQHPTFYRNKFALLCSFGTLFSSFFIYWNHSSVSYYAYFISLFGLMAFKNEGNFTLLNYAFTYLINLFTTPIVILNKYANRRNNNKSETDLTENTYYDKLKKISGYLVVIFIIVIFFFVYQAANPLFYQYTKEISLFNINYGFIFYSIIGMLLLFILFYETVIKMLFEKESKQTNNIYAQNYLGAYLEKHRLQTILFLFAALNVMLLFINMLDVNYLYLSHTMPKGITQAQFVHNGVGTLIFSIVLGASIICYLFKGELNFIQENKTIKLLVYAWIAQNIFMVISTLLRNNLYVQNCGLTGKRIGVYYYLFFTIIGLLFTAYKIHKQKTVYFLYATNTWIWYSILVLSSSVNWENIIFNNQLKRYNTKKVLDFEYATRFTESNLPELISLFNVGKKDSVDLKNPNNIYSKCANYDILKRLTESDFVTFLLHQDGNEWQSYNKINQDIYKQILKLNQQQQFDSITLYQGASEYTETPIKAISCLTNLKTIVITDDIIDFKNLTLLKNVETIVWLGADKNALKYFKLIKNLKQLDLPNMTEPSKDYFKNILPDVTVTTQATEVIARYAVDITNE